MSRRVSYITFIAMDGLAALISVPVWVYLGYFFADNIDLLMEYVGDVQKLIYLSLAVVMLICVIIYVKKKFKHKMQKFSDNEQK